MLVRLDGRDSRADTRHHRLASQRAPYLQRHHAAGRACAKYVLVSGVEYLGVQGLGSYTDA